MDFWAQHKDFVLKILAGFGVFLVALIARGITYGDELEEGADKNRKLAGGIKRIKLAKPQFRRALAEERDKLKANIARMVGEIGWDQREERLEIELIRRTLGYLARYRGGGASAARDIASAASADWEAIKANLNGGFPQLRLKVRDALVEEAAEKNIEIKEGIGFQSLLKIQPEELVKYLMQLELSARLVRSCIDAGALGIDEVNIDTQPSRRAVIPGANPNVLEEYAVTIRFRAHQPSVIQVLNSIEQDRPQVPVRRLLVARLKLPPNAVGVELSVMALAFDAEAKFKAEEKKDR